MLRLSDYNDEFPATQNCLDATSTSRSIDVTLLNYQTSLSFSCFSVQQSLRKGAGQTYFECSSLAHSFSVNAEVRLNGHRFAIQRAEWRQRRIGHPGSETRILPFWNHQKTRLTDGHSGIPAGLHRTTQDVQTMNRRRAINMPTWPNWTRIWSLRRLRSRNSRLQSHGSGQHSARKSAATTAGSSTPGDTCPRPERKTPAKFRRAFPIS